MSQEEGGGAQSHACRVVDQMLCKGLAGVKGDEDIFMSQRKGGGGGGGSLACQKVSTTL